MAPPRAPWPDAASLAVLYSCVALDVASFGMAWPLQPLLQETLRTGPLGAVAVSASYHIMKLTGNFVVGRVADRVGYRATLCACMTGLSLCNFALGLVQTPEWFILVGGLAGYCSGTVGLVQAALSLGARPADHARYQSYLAAAVGAGLASGAGLSGLVEHWISLRGLVLLAGGLCGAAALGVPLLDPLPRKLARAGNSSALGTRARLAKVRETVQEHRDRAPVYVSSFALAFAFGSVEAAGRQYFVEASAYGVLLFASGCGQLLMNVLLPRPLLRLLGTAGCGALAAACAALAYGLASLPGRAAAYAFAVALPLGTLAVAPQAVLIGALSRPVLRGAAMGTNQAIVALGRLVGVFTAALTYRFYPRGIWFQAIGASLVAVYAFLWIHCLRRVETHDEVPRQEPEAESPESPAPELEDGLSSGSSARQLPEGNACEDTESSDSTA